MPPKAPHCPNWRTLRERGLKQGAPRAGRAGASPRQHAARVNELVNAYLSRVGDALGTTGYRTLFGLAPGQPIVLVDPEIAALAEVSAAL